jgi:hypothetical protein
VTPPGRSGERALVRLPPDLAHRYTRSVAAVALRVEAVLGPRVLANRTAVADPGPPRLELEPWLPARRRFAARAQRLGRRSGALLSVDVRDCYGSIGPDLVDRVLRDLACPSDAVQAVGRVLRDIGDHGVSGLPVGPEPSAVLANAVLAPVDRALVGAGMVHLRWVDDFWVFAPDPASAVTALPLLERALDAIGLRLAPEKTRLLDGLEVPLGTAGSPPLSGRGPRYHRRSDAYPVPGVPGPHPLPSAARGVDPGRRSARRARGIG